MNNVERKLKVYNTERYTVSKFKSIDVAAMYFFWNPTQGPFIVVPCLEEENKETKYTLTFYSNNKIDLQRLDEERNRVIIGLWAELSDGGCELYTPKFEKTEITRQTWGSNPQYIFKFKNQDIQGPVRVKVKL